MRSPEKQKERLQVPLMYAFRDAYQKHDSEKQEDIRVDGERVVSDRSSLRRRATDEVMLKRDLALDLGNLVDTVDLASVVDLSEFDYVRKSVLNYGLYDLTHVMLGSGTAEEIVGQLRTALLQHEPRLAEESLTVEKLKDDDDVNQRVRFRVHAEIMSKPLDIPIEFVAEVDPTSGKIRLPRLATT